MVGSSILRKLKAAGFNNLVVKSRKHLNLIDGNQALGSHQILNFRVFYFFFAKL